MPESQYDMRKRLAQDCICDGLSCGDECKACAQLDPEEPCLKEDH